MDSKVPYSSRFVGKNAIVTAGTQGIGRAIAHRLALEGANVYICSRKQENVDEAIKSINEEIKRAKDCKGRINGCACNVGDLKSLDSFIENAVSPNNLNGKIDVIVSNAGVNPVAGNALDMEVATFDKIMGTNVRSHWYLIKKCKPYLSRDGSIILMSSLGGFQPSHPAGIYGMSKTALISLGRALASELGQKGIRINSICPGVIKTKMSKAFWEGDMSDGLAKTVALQRHGEAYEVANLCAFLASDEASFITGESFVITGGSSSRL